jgi:competence protein ComEA
MRKHLLILALGACLASGSVFAGAVNVNAADAKTLAKELDGVGEIVAAEIVKERANGPYKSAEDLAKRVKGFGDKTLEKNKANIKIAGN